ncbi:DUF2267 domain-containing protein [Halomonas daqiaonensis]|uniref:Uncharacterized conserved protein, DUF2267 family n=1 Tax=Halomonas daqiaonensis TaxID=650850 RepID=A0A1H7MPN4_9GAMM|nr:DUF2267 domain-containing protein [Halomonas daqiaonensis]SEL12798.1 Uncharacterized conserved protein, DUF2267 family [Halomonas daqiaonensis]
MGHHGKSEEELQREREVRHEGHLETTYKTFINELCLPGDLRQDEAECAAVAVLCTLESRIEPEESQDMEAQLPQKLRELLAHCRHGKEEAPQRFGKKTFLERIAADLDVSAEEAESLTRRVFTTLRDQISDGEIQDVEGQLPPDIADLWRAPPV